MTKIDQSRLITIRKLSANQLITEEPDEVALEEPLEIRIRGNAIATTMRTPGNDIDLVAGFILTEGIIKKRSDILEIAHCVDDKTTNNQNIANAYLNPNIGIDSEKIKRHFYANSSCGICGKTTIESVQSLFPLIESDISISIKELGKFPQKLRDAQNTFKQTGGLHAAALFDIHGSIIHSSEDVGRHNAVDKVIGYSVLREIELSSTVLMVSGRVSYEIMQKSLAGKIPIVAAISAPTSLAVEFATENKQTLIGFMRNNKMNIYTGHERIY
tara:strand:- start:2352 stop:3167 length:816 start_codon:yes stop_codon:yes gene_type:complete